MRARTLTRLLCLPAILGWLGACASAPEPDAWGIALGKIGEINQVRCPALAKADVATLKSRTPPRPQHWKEKGAARGELQARVDQLELAIETKADAGTRAVGEHARCRGEEQARTS